MAGCIVAGVLAGLIPLTLAFCAWLEHRERVVLELDRREGERRKLDSPDYWERERSAALWDLAEAERNLERIGRRRAPHREIVVEPGDGVRAVRRRMF